MSVVALPGPEETAPPFPVRRFTVDEYHWMIDAGFFVENENFELLEGWIVPEMTRNPPHDVAIGVTQVALQGLLPPGWALRVQSAITTDDSEPEPDIAVVRGSLRDYVNHHPGPAEIGLLVESSDASLERDREVKAPLYARARIPVYWILNLVDMRIEVYSDPSGPGLEPSYRRRQDYGPDEAVPLVLDGQEIAQIAVRDLLP